MPAIGSGLGFGLGFEAVGRGAAFLDVAVALFGAVVLRAVVERLAVGAIVLFLAVTPRGTAPLRFSTGLDAVLITFCMSRRMTGSAFTRAMMTGSAIILVCKAAISLETAWGMTDPEGIAVLTPCIIE